MDPGIKEDKTIPKGRATCFNLSVAFLLLNVSNFIVPVTGFALRTCRISGRNVVCKPLDDETKITAVPQDIPSTVKGLDLSGNEISKIVVSDFGHFPVLIQLDLNSNRIKYIESGAFANLSSLEKLNLNNNKLGTLGDDFFYGLTNLTELRIHKNQISLVAPTSFKSLTSLNVLDISNNKLFNLSDVRSIIQHLPNLKVLYLQGNRLTDFHSWQLTNSSLGLTSLDLSKNPLKVFMMTADIFPNLTWLGVGYYSKLKTWNVRNKTFLSQVSTLDISGLRLELDVIKALLESVNSSLSFLRMNNLDGIKHHIFSAIMNIACSIPTMSKLQLREKNCKSFSSGWIQLCVNITDLNLAHNKIQDIQAGAFSNIQGLRILDLSRNRLPSVPAATRNLPALVELDLSKNNISALTCCDFANMTNLRKLYLYQNSISALQECLFKDLIQLQVLKLQNNTIRTLGGAFLKSLPNLRQLDLEVNFLPEIKPGEFQGLRSLDKLSLQENLIKTLNKGCFIGLTNLTEIQLQSNKIQDLKQEFFNDLTNLRQLDLGNNQIRYTKSSDLPHPPFRNLLRLETLAIYAQHHRGRFHLPSNILQGLTNLTIFNMRNMRLFSLPNDIFRFTPKLQKLDMRSNDLEDFPPDLFFPIQNLKSLYLSTTNLHSLDFLINANLSNLELFEAKKNSFSVLREEVMKSLPALSYLDLQGNGFICDCDNTWFIQWAKQDNQTQVYDAYGYKCNYPSELKGKKLLDFDIESCSVNIDFICFVSTTCTILLFMVVSFGYHFLRWQLAYAYYFFLALLVDTKNKNRDTANQYDAFISYNTHDEPWVIRELMPKLEGEQGWRLCLHHRDFEPGKPIVDNITDAIYGSRKTICVISRRYLESEWCSREMQVASFRLFDEQKDVLILVFLEEIPTYQLSPYYRMRKLLKRKTYLSWPRAGEHTKIFWEKLRQALKTREHLGEDKTLHNVVDRQYP